MLAFVITVTVVLQGHPVKFHHVSQQRFPYFDQCMEEGDRVVSSMIARLKRYHRKPAVRVKLDCDEQVTFES